MNARASRPVGMRRPLGSGVTPSQEPSAARSTRRLAAQGRLPPPPRSGSAGGVEGGRRGPPSGHPRPAGTRRTGAASASTEPAHAGERRSKRRSAPRPRRRCATPRRPPRSSPPPPSPRATPASTDADGFAQVTAPADIAFPRDHAPHPGFRLEWWYVTANLTGPDGTPYGAQWTLFRQATAPGGDGPGWESPQIWMAHAAATSATDHRFAETFARGGIGQAGVTLAPFRAWIDDWIDDRAPTTASPTLAPPPPHGDGFAYDLALATDRPPVPQGDRGFSVKSDARPGLLLLQPALLRRHRHPHPRRRATSRSPATPGSTANGRRSRWPPGQHGWDWFALHLDTGASADGLPPAQRRRPACARRHLDRPRRHRPTRSAPTQITATPGATAEVAGRSLPVALAPRHPRLRPRGGHARR